MTVVRTRSVGDILVIAVDSPPVNALAQRVRSGIQSALEQAAIDGRVKVLVICCKGRTFFAGADISELGKPSVSPTLRELIALVESSAKPVVAAIHGAALGGGLELALACHYRISTPDAVFGLPEVKLGLLPGAGGTQRLPRLVGAPESLAMIVSGNSISCNRAKDIGLIDRVSAGNDLESEAIAFAHTIAMSPERRVTSEEQGKVSEAQLDPGIFDRYLANLDHRARKLDAPSACIRAIRAAVELPFVDGLRLERELFLELVQGDQSKALRHVFFAERAARKIDGLNSSIAPLSIGTVGIVGAGTMGTGIAMSFVGAGIPVVMVEQDQHSLDCGVSRIRKNFAFARGRSRMSTTEVDEAMSLISASADDSGLASCDLIIEAVFEDLAIKKQVFRRLDSVAKPGAILASNTSYLNLDEIALETGRPDHVVGLHFFSPANVMKLLEVVRGRNTSDLTLVTAMELAKRLGKTAVVSRVCHGFIGNRMLSPRQREANKLIMAGATPWDVDRVLTTFGFPMGPFQMADLAGLDIGWNEARSTGSTLREILCEAGRRGQKNGRGYYDYDQQRQGTPSPLAWDLIAQFRAATGHKTRHVDDQEILERLLYPLINEGAQILDEGVAQRASDIDVVWTHGYGWPKHTGGPMFWAGTIGLDQVVGGLTCRAEQLLPEFRMSALLQDMAERGAKFD